MPDLWFDAPPDRHEAPPGPVRSGGDAVAHHGPDVWAVSTVDWPDRPADLNDAELAGAFGVAVECAAYAAHVAGAELPAPLLEWGTRRSVPAADIGPGRPVVVLIDDVRVSGTAWDFPPLTATVTVTEAGTLCAIAPATWTPVNLRSTDAGAAQA